MTRPRTEPMAVTLAPGRPVTCEEVHDVAVHGHRLLVSAERLEQVRLASAVVERALARGRMI
jgi:histidine ammonia-lyase